MQGQQKHKQPLPTALILVAELSAPSLPRRLRRQVGGPHERRAQRPLDETGDPKAAALIRIIP